MNYEGSWTVASERLVEAGTGEPWMRRMTVCEPNTDLIE